MFKEAIEASYLKAKESLQKMCHWDGCVIVRLFKNGHRGLCMLLRSEEGDLTL